MRVYVIPMSSKQGDLILDPFAGSGTTGIACNELGGHFIGCEKDYPYYEVSLNRTIFVDICRL